ncbi:hypothetical protein D3C76_1347600 [compost metagenome]
MAVQAVTQAQALARHWNDHVPGAGTDLRVTQRCEQLPEGVAGPLVVGVGEYQYVADRLCHGRIQHAGLAHARQIQHLDARVVDAQGAGHGVIAGAIAGNDDLQFASLVILGQHGAQFFFDVPAFVVGGDDNAQRLGGQRQLPPPWEQRCQRGQGQWVAQIGIHRQQQAQPEDEFSHVRVSLRSSYTGS